MRLWEDSAKSDPALGDDLLRARFRFKRGEFLRFLLPSIYSSPWNAFHLAVLGNDKRHWSEQLRDSRALNLAPRGVGKSTLKKGDVAHSVCYGLRRFLVVVSATRDDAKGWAATLRQWFGPRDDSNAALHDLYGPFALSGEQQRFTIAGPEGPCTILCTSVNASVQGANELTHRPDEVILDDWEDRKRVRSQTQREGWSRKLREEILKLGDRQRGLITEACVTVNHPEQPSARIRRGDEGFAGWDVHEFPALLSWPEDLGLWNRAGRIFNDLTLGDVETREACALAFYEAHRAEMDQGAELLDPHLLPLFRCWLMIWAEGMSAFLREMQHKTQAPGEHLFDSRSFSRCQVSTDQAGALVVRLADGRKIAAASAHRKGARWDPAMGTQGGDVAAIAVLLRDEHGYVAVVDCWRKVAPVSAQLAAAWTLAEKWGLTTISLESNGFQALIDQEFRRQREERKAAGQFWQLRLVLDASTGNKEDRLSTLEAPIAGGILQFAEHLDPDVFGEFDEFDGVPNSHQDGAHDAIEGAYARLKGRAPSMEREKRLR